MNIKFKNVEMEIFCSIVFTVEQMCSCLLKVLI